jgi:medium-chain acyl-[acyl-carrier-protein] hydrolase
MQMTNNEVNFMLYPSSSDLWFEHLSPPSKRGFCLFCFPYAGGSAQIFRHWQRYFFPEVDICLVHLPGRDRRIGEEPYKRLEPMVEALADAMKAQIQSPFAFYGHSMGSLISFELARELQRRHKIAPREMFLSGHYAPPAPRTGPPSFSLSDDEFLERLKNFNGTPTELLNDPEIQELFLPLLRADFEVVDSYDHVPGEPLPCPITTYGGLQDTDVPVEGLHAWRKHTLSTCNVRMLPGDHFFIQTCGTEFMNILRRDVFAAVHAQGQRKQEIAVLAPR